MKVLVATRTTQGSREGDFSRTIEGELVFDAGPCMAVADDGKWNCECSIAFRGVASGELTTTAMVADLPMRMAEYQEAVCDALALKDICSDCARDYGRAAWKLAMRWPTGTIIERHQMRFAPRVRQRS